MVQRYNKIFGELVEAPDGDFYLIHRDDYDAIEQQCKELGELYSKATEDVVTKALRVKELEADNSALERHNAELAKKVQEWKMEWRMELAHSHQEEERNRELEDAIRWALGEKYDFPSRKIGGGAYWWRKELRRRSGIQLPPDTGEKG